MNNNVLQPGTMLRGGTYRVEQALSSGGFGNTYVVTNVNFDETYVMKEFYMKEINMRDGNTVSVSIPGNEATFNSQRNKFQKEARRLRKLNNEHIVGVHDLFDENGTSYYVMDFIDGESLSARLKRTGQPMSEAEMRTILDQVLDALESVHSQGIWHLDLKPGNIMLDKQGKALLIDFGASKQIQNGEGFTTTSGLCYTPGYAPIEQIEQSLDKFGPWTDIYALGATLYHCLTLRPLPSPMELVEDGANILQFPPSVSQSMRQLVERMMQPNRKNRPQSIADVRQLLNNPGQVPETPVSNTESETTVAQMPPTPKAAPPVPPQIKPQPKPQPTGPSKPVYVEQPRRKAVWPYIVVAAVLALLVLGGGGIFLASRLLKSEPDIVATTDSVATESLTALAETEEVPVEQTEVPTATTEEKDEPQPVRDEPDTRTVPDKPVAEQPASRDIPAERPTAQTQNQGQLSKVQTTTTQTADDRVYEIVETMPSFRQGDIRAWISRNLEYPVVAEENGIQGRVVVGFIVERDGSISNVKVLRGVDPSLDKEAMRVIKAMPKWNPGYLNGQPVRVKYSIPVQFKLQ